LRRKAINNITALGKNTLSIGLGVVGLFPIASLPASIGGLILESQAFLVNLSQSFQSLKALNDYKVYLQHKEMVLKKTIQRSEISDQSTCLDVVNMLMDTIRARITF
jgi:hypothetical protein